MIELGQGRDAMERLQDQLYDLRYDRYAQNQLLREISDQLRRGGGYLNLDRWNANRGTWDTIEIVPPPPAPRPPDQPPPVVEQPIPVPTYEDDPWMQMEGTVVPALLDSGNSNAAANRLNSDLYALRGNIEAQNVLLGMVEKGDRKGAGTDLRLGEWNPNTGTFEKIEILPALTDPGKGIPVSTFESADAPQPPGVIDTTKTNDSQDPWLHQEIAVIGALLDAGDATAAATRLVSDLQALKGDLQSQNELLAQVQTNNAPGGAELNLGAWDPNVGTYTNTEVLPNGSTPGTGIAIKTYPE